MSEPAITATATQEQRTAAYRLRTAHGYGARRIARELGISRYAAGQLLARPPAGASGRPVADAAAGVAGEAGPAAGRPAEVADPVPEVADPVAEVAPAGPWLRVDLSRRPQLLRDIHALRDAGIPAPVAAEAAVTAFADAYRRALARGELRPGQPYEVLARVRAATPSRTPSTTEESTRAS